MTTTVNSAVLRFKSDTSERIQITVPRARTDMTEANARAAMQAMIAGNAILTSFGRPAAILDAEIVTTERTPMLGV